MREKVVVIGSNNSAHDICAALYEAGVDVTMVQRSTTHIVRSDSLMASIADLYSERAVRGGMTTAQADLIFASLPYKILAGLQKPVYDKILKYLDTYAKQRGITMVFEATAARETQSIVFRANTVDITQDFIKEYNKQNPVR